MPTLRIEMNPEGRAKLAGAKWLVKEPARLLKRIGVILLASSQAAFDEQKFGNVQWPERYAHQARPVLNIAGAIADLSDNDQIKDRRFDPRPAGIDTGALRNSLSPFAGGAMQAGYAIQVGSTLPYAALIHGGGDSEPQQLTATVRDNLTLWLEREGTSDRGQLVKERLGFVYTEEEHVTEVMARPFIGITDASRLEINEMIEEEVVRGRS